MSDQPNITLTPRQQRALRHLARRHMHHPRITRRRMFSDYTSLSERTQSIVPDEPPVGASAKLAERVSIPGPQPIYRPSRAANIPTPPDTVGTQPIAPDKPAGGADAKLPARGPIPRAPRLYDAMRPAETPTAH